MTEPVKVVGAVFQLVGLTLMGYAYFRHRENEQFPVRSVWALVRATPEQKRRLAAWYQTPTFRIHLTGWLLFGIGLVLFYLSEPIQGIFAP